MKVRGEAFRHELVRKKMRCLDTMGRHCIHGGEEVGPTTEEYRRIKGNNEQGNEREVGR